MSRGLSFALNDLPAAMRQQAQEKLRLVGAVRGHVCQDGPKKTASKFGNTKCVIDNIMFDSLKEGRRYQELKLLEVAKEIHWLQCHVPFSLKVRNTEICVYIADFVYRKRVGKTEQWSVVVEDVKGYKRGAAYRVFRIKKALMMALKRIDVVEV